MDEKKNNLLLIDNNPLDQQAFKRFFREKQLPYNLLVCGSFKEAAALVSQTDFDLVFLDYHLGDGNGLELLPLINDMPVIIVTGHGSEAVAVEAMKLGATDYLIKDVGNDYLGLIPRLVEKMLSQQRMAIDNKRLNNQIRLILELSGEGILGFGKQGELAFANRAAQDILGYKIGELTDLSGEEFHFLIHNNAQKREAHSLEDCNAFQFFRKGEFQPNREEVFWKKDGTRVFVDFVVTPVEDPDGSHGFIMAFRDITRQKQVEEELKYQARILERLVLQRTADLKQALCESEENREKVSAIFKSINQGLLLVNDKMEIVMINPAAHEYLDIPAGNTVGRPLDQIIRDQTIRDKFSSHLKTHPYRFRFEFESSNNRILSAQSNPLGNPSQNSGEVIIVFQDVTYEIMDGRKKTEFLSLASHELRTPLTSIKGFSEYLLARAPGEEQRNKYLAYIVEECETLTEIMDQFLDISRIESGAGYSLDKRSCSILDTIKKTLSHFELVSKNHRFVLVSPENLGNWEVDHRRLDQILTNIYSNAVKYSPEGREIITRVIQKDGVVEVSIQDEGKGMTPQQVRRVFDKFFRAEGLNGQTAGTGLGMTIVKKLVHLHGGKTWVESEYGKQTTVTFTIPVVSEDEKNSRLS